MFCNGELTTINASVNAQALRICTMFQHFSLFKTLTFAENIALTPDEHSVQFLLANSMIFLLLYQPQYYFQHERL